MAKEMYEKAAEINHRLYLAYYSLGIIALFEKDLDSAMEYFQKSIYEDLEPSAYYQLAKIYILKKVNKKPVYGAYSKVKSIKVK